MAKQDILFPVGRLVGGNLYKPRTTDDKGNPLVYKSGADKGKQREEFSFALAIPKVAGQHWASSPWGAIIWQVGHAFKANAGNMGRNFAWKVIDGDSTEANKKGKKPCDNEGYPGNWVLWFSSSYAPRIVDKTGQRPIVDVDAVKAGYYVQVFGNVDQNGSEESPGVYLNFQFVSLQAYGAEISFGADASQIGFGQEALPAGATAVPEGAYNGPAAAPAPTAPPPGAPAVPTSAPTTPPPPATVAPSAPPAGAVSAPSTPPPPATVVTPNYGALPAVPGATPPPPAAPVAPAAPAATVGPQLTAKAADVTYEQFLANGWTDDTLRANGYLL